MSIKMYWVNKVLYVSTMEHSAATKEEQGIDVCTAWGIEARYKTVCTPTIYLKREIYTHVLM